MQQNAFAIQREYPTMPILAVGAVVLDADSVLLVRRAKAPLAREWSLPGGVVELGETLQQAVTREVREETGLAVEPLAVLDTLEKIERDSAGHVQYHYVLVEFFCKLVSGYGVTASNLQAASDALEARWAPLHDLRVTNVFHLTPTCLDMIEKGQSQSSSASH